MPQDGFGIANHTHVHVPVLPNLGAVHHNLDQLRVLGEHVFRAIPQPEVDGSSDQQHRIRLDQPVAAAKAADVGMVGGHAAPAHGVEEDGRVNHFDELTQFLRSVAPPYIGPSQDHGPFGGFEDIHNLGDVGGVSIGLGIGAVTQGITDFVFFALAVHYIDGHLQVDRAGDSGGSLAEGLSYVFGDPLNPLHLF